MTALHATIRTLTLRHPFGISRGTSVVRDNVFLEFDGGWGEAAPYRYRGETAEAVLKLCQEWVPQVQERLSIQRLRAQLEPLAAQHPSFVAAMEMAGWDRLGKQLGAPVYRLLGLCPAKTPLTSFTIGLDEPEVMLQKLAEARDYPILKIKVGSEQDVDIVRAMREQTQQVLRVDANCGWTRESAPYRLDALAELGVELVEQPLPDDDWEGLRELHHHSRVPIFLDESIHTAADVARAAGYCSGVNLKLMKCGGLSSALAAIHTARAYGLSVMLGCMIESSLAISAAAQLSPLADLADLDGNLLIANDPFVGVRVEHGRLLLGATPGLGAVPRR